MAIRPSVSSSDGEEEATFRNAVGEAVYSSLRRLSGGGVIVTDRNGTDPSEALEDNVRGRTGDVLRDDGRRIDGAHRRRDDEVEEQWRDELKRLAHASVSFPNRTLGGGAPSSSSVVHGKPHDVEVRAALSFYHRYKCKSSTTKRAKNQSSKKRRRRQQTKGQDGDLEEFASTDESPPQRRRPVLEIVSDLGLVRSVDSAVAFAALLAQDLEDSMMASSSAEATEAAAAKLRPTGETSTDRTSSVSSAADDAGSSCLRRWTCRDVRPDQSGIICLVTETRAEALRGSGLLPCPKCVKWCKGQKGLWWHQQREHDVDHSFATESAAAQVNPLAIVPYKELISFLPDNPSRSLAATNEAETPLADEDNRYDVIEIVKSGNLLDLTRAIERGCDPASELDRNGATPLHWAAGCGHLDIVTYLIESCYYPAEEGQRGKRSFSGRTPLHWSARNGHLPVVQYLVDVCKVDVDATTLDGTTAFCWASWQGHSNVMRFLFSRGCDPHKLNTFGCNAVLWCAQGNGCLETMKWLNSISCDFSLVNSNGHGVLHKAAQRGNRKVCIWFASLLDVNGVCHVDPKSDQWSLFSLDLLGPDSESNCPSDLAGMEGHHNLSHWIADREIALALQWFRRTEEEARLSNGTGVLSPVPNWLQKAMDETSLVHNIHHFEAGGGVRRMAIAMARDKGATAIAMSQVSG